MKAGGIKARCVLLLAVTWLTACGHNVPNDGPSGLQVAGNAAGWDGGEAFVRAVISNGSNNDILALGSLHTSGDFFLVLPDDPFLESFGPFSCDPSSPGVLVSTPNTLKVVLVRGFGVTTTERRDVDEIGLVAYAKGDLQSGGNVVLGGYAYATERGSVTGTCAGPGNITDSIFDLDLQEGWNRVLISFETTAENIYVTTFRTGELPGELAWIYSPYPPTPNDGPGPP